MRQRARLISFTPCRLDCPAALAQAVVIHRLVREHAAAAAPVLEDMLQRPLVIGPTGARAWVRTTGDRISAAEAPYELPDGAAEAADVEHARTWANADLALDGHVLGCGQPAPRLLDFSVLR